MGEFDEDRDAAAARPGDPSVQGLLAGLALDREHVPQALFQQVGPVQAGVGLGDPGQLGGLAFGEVLGVLPQRVPGALELAGVLVTPGAAGCPCRGGRGPAFGSVRANARASFQARRRSASSASVAQATTWNGSAQRTAVGQRSATTSAIQSAASADTCVISAHRSAPRASKKRRSVVVVAAGARPTPAGRSRGRPRPSGTCGGACRRSRRCRSGAGRRTGRRCLSASAQTRATIAPTVRHAIRISSHTAVFEHATASQATVSSKSRVCPACGAPTAPPPPSARGWGSSPAARRPPATPAPCPDPGPASGAGPHPGRTTAPSARSGRSGPAHPARGRTCATTTSPSALSSRTRCRSITVRLSTPNSARHNLTLRTSFPRPFGS